MATAQVVQTNRLIKTALHQAVLDERLKQVRLLVTRHHANVDCRDMYGRTPLILACLVESEECGYRMVKLLIEAGAQANPRDNMGRTALSYACMKGRGRIVRAILKEDILGVNDPDNDGNTPLGHAATAGNPVVVEIIVKTLMKYGLSVDHRNNLGYTPLLLAVKYGNYTTAYLILDAGASPALRDNEFFLNADEWAAQTCQSRDFHEHKRRIRCASSDLTRQAKIKLSSMYRKPITPECNHVKSAPDPFRVAWDSGRFPAIFTGHTHSDLESDIVDGLDPKARFLEKLYSVATREMPVDRRRNIASAKLRALDEPRKRPSTVKSDVRTLFKIYADQHTFDPRPRPMTVAAGEKLSRRSIPPSNFLMSRFKFHSPIQEEGSLRSLSVA